MVNFFHKKGYHEIVRRRSLSSLRWRWCCCAAAGCSCGGGTGPLWAGSPGAGGGCSQWPFVSAPYSCRPTQVCQTLTQRVRPFLMIRLIFDEFNEIRRKKIKPWNETSFGKNFRNHDRKNPFVFQEPRHPEDFPEFSIPGSYFSSPGVSVNFCLFVQPVTNEAIDFRSKITFFSVTKKTYFFFKTDFLAQMRRTFGGLWAETNQAGNLQKKKKREKTLLWHRSYSAVWRCRGGKSYKQFSELCHIVLVSRSNVSSDYV